MNDEGGGASRSTDPAAGTSSATDVSLREWITANQRRNDERFAFMAVLGAVIWFFIERHMSNLNNEGARLKQQQDATVSSDTYEANEKQREAALAELGEWRKEVDRDRTQSVSREDLVRETKDERRQGVTSGWQWVGGTVAIIAVLVTMWAVATRPTAKQPTIIVRPTVTVPAK